MSIQTLRNLYKFAATSIACAVMATMAQAQTSRFDELANAAFTENRPGDETADGADGTQMDADGDDT